MGSATTLSNLLAKTQAYELVATQTRSFIAQSSAIPAQYQAAFTQALASSITADQIKTVLDPLLVDLVSWLNQPQATPAPQLVVSIVSVKQAFASSLQAAKLSPSELAVAQAQINQQLPDQLDLAKLQSIGMTGGGQLTGQAIEGAAPSPQPGVNSFQRSLMNFKQTYQALKTFSVVGLMVLATLTALLIYLSRREGRAMLRRPAWVFIWAGVMTVVLYVLTRFVGNAPADMTSTNASQGAMLIAGVFAREAMNIVIVYGLLSLLVGGILYGLSFFIRRPLSTNQPVSPAPKPPLTR